ncbi:MAG: HK97 family phage prohead protease [Methanothrix sp.]|nr:HK97 family phage prohead protease [Methanothrix sp.]
MKIWSPGEPLETGESLIRLASKDVFSRETIDDDIIIEGWFTTEKLNSYNQIVKATSFAWKGGTSLFNGRVLAFHDQRKEPVGLVLSMQVKEDEGLWGKVKIFREAAPLFKRSINEGVLNAFSIGFTVEKYEYDEETEIITFLRCKLLEVSIVNVGANEEALFEVVHSIIAQLPDAAIAAQTQTVIQERKNKMADPKTIVNPADLQLDKGDKQVQELAANLQELRQMQITLKESLEAQTKGFITRADFLNQVDRMSTDLTRIQKDVEVAKNAIARDKELVEHFTFNDPRSLLEIGKYDYLKTHDGLPFNELQYRGYRLFQMPVDYKSHSRGQELINIRTLCDAVLCVDAWHRFHSMGAAGGGRYRLENQPLWQQFVKAVEPFDSVLAHAMAGGNAGYGAEWVPTEFSAEFNEYLRIQPNLPNKFKWWLMPPSGSGYYPFQNGKATVYKGGESLVDNAAQARKTNIATAQKLFTPVLFIGALVSSENLIEDAIIDMVAMIRAELSTAVLEGLEDCLINGDATAAHMDDVHTTTYTPTYSVRKCFDGLRHIALGDSNSYDSEVPSADTGAEALTVAGITFAINKLGVFGVADTANCLFITGVKGKYQFQQALEKEDALGVLPYIISGKLPPLGGVDTYITGQFIEDLDTDGLYNAGASSHTAFLCVHLPSFRIAQRRGITLEMSKDILTQQQQFVASARFDFGKVCASALTPVSYGINAQYT